LESQESSFHSTPRINSLMESLYEIGSFDAVKYLRIKFRNFNSIATAFLQCRDQTYLLNQPIADFSEYSKFSDFNTNLDSVGDGMRFPSGDSLLSCISSQSSFEISESFVQNLTLSFPDSTNGNLASGGDSARFSSENSLASCASSRSSSMKVIGNAEAFSPNSRAFKSNMGVDFLTQLSAVAEGGGRNRGIEANGIG